MIQHKEAEPAKLDSGQKNFLRLIEKGSDEDGWALVSATLFPITQKTMPPALVELERVGDEGRGRARLTEQGRNLLAAMAWL